MRRRAVLGLVGSALAGSAGCVTTSSGTAPPFRVSSPAVANGDPLPTRFTCDGAGDSPPLSVSGGPEDIAGYAVVASFNLGVITNPMFWSLWNVPPDRTEIPAGLPRAPTVETLDGAGQGRQPGVDPGYDPVCPPAGKTVEPWFDVYALGSELSVEGGARHDEAVDAIESAALASSRITVSYTRPSDPATTTPSE